MEEQQFVCYKLGNTDILEIIKGFEYAVPSRTELNVYRTVKIKIDSHEGIHFECDCNSGFYRSKRDCHHKKLVQPIVYHLAKTQYYTKLKL